MAGLAASSAADAAGFARYDVGLEREKREALDSLGDCFMGTGRRKVMAALLADPMTASFEKWADGHSATCYLDVAKKHRSWVSPEGETLRYTLAEAAFRRDLQGVRLTNLEAVPPLSHGIPEYRQRYAPLSPRELQQKAVNDRSALYLSKVGECVVRADPDGAQRLLVSKPISAAEDQAFDAISPAISTCIDATQKITFDRQSLRGAIALNYLRLQHALANGPATKAVH